MDTWPFTGRDSELRDAVDAVSRAGCLVLAGPPGVGKSRLARELVARVGEPGRHGFVTATECSRRIPLGALASWTGPVAGAEPDVTAVQQAAQALAAGGPTSVLGVDDAHLLDDVSAVVLRNLAAERAVRLVLTVRSRADAPDAITSLWKDGPAERLDLAPLAEAPTRALLRAVLDGPVDPAAERRFFQTTRGNVLWLRHLVEGERRAGRLVDDGGGWRWDGPAGLPPALRDLVGLSIGVLTEGQGRVLELLALGEPLGLGALNRLATPEAVEQVTQRGLAQVRREGARWEVRVAHPLYAEVVRARLGSPRARRLRGELAGLFAAGRRAGDDLRRAVLGLDSDTAPEPAVLVRAAGQAVGLTDYELAERLFRAACDAGGGFDAQLGRASVLAWVTRVPEADAALASASASATTDVQRIRAALLRSMVLFTQHDDAESARGALDAVAAEVGDPDARTTVDAGRAALVLGAGDVQRGARLAGAVLAVPDVAPWAAAWAGWPAVYARALSGRGAPIADLVRRGIGAARARPETVALQNNLAFGEVIGVCLEGEPARARTRTQWIREQPGSHGAAFGAMVDAYAQLARGRPRTTVRLVGEVLPHLPGRGGGWTAFLAALLAAAHGALGESAGASAALALAGRAASTGLRVFDPYLELGRAWRAAADGALVDARDHLARGTSAAHASGSAAVEVLVRHTAVCFGDRGQAPQLEHLARTLDGPAAPVAVAHARALAAGDDAALMVVSARLEAAERLLFAADAAAQAAVLARRANRLPEAAVAAARAAALAEQCEGARTPALVAADSPLPLRERERQIAMLAAGGLTNRAIADRLRLSVRTVESHVYRACSRLGLADRAALVAAVLPGTAPGATGPLLGGTSAAPGGHAG